MAKSNHLLNQYKTRIEAEHQVKRMILGEVNMMAFLIAAHDVFGCGPGRASRFLHAYVQRKVEISGLLSDDVGESAKKKNGSGDPDFMHTRRDLSRALKYILGREGWSNYKEFFTLLSDFWPWEA